MAVLKLAAFSGEQPQIIPRLLPDNAAQSAIDVRLRDGSLAPYRTPVTAHAFNLSELGITAIGTIFLDGEDWLAFEDVVDIVRGPVAMDRLYYTGDGAPKLLVSGDTYDLALAAPASALTATSDGLGSGDIETRAYAFTYVTSFGEELEPSALSDEVDWQPGDTITLSGFPAVPTGRAITHQRIYRTQTGASGTDLFFIAERAAGTGDFTDDIAIDAFAEPIPSKLWTPPPSDLAGLTGMANGMMAGFVGKTLYFCEPFRPHAWPEVYALAVDYDIVALAAAGNSLWVLTEGQPYLATGTAPESMVLEKIEANFPCINAQAVVDLGYAVAYPTPDGLAIAQLGAGVRIASQNLFEPKAWRDLIPGTMRAGQIAGRWIGSYSTTDDNGDPLTGSLIIDLTGKDSFLVRTAIAGRVWHYDIASGSLYFLDAGDGVTVRQFDPDNAAPASFYWRSKKFVLPKPENFGAALVETGEGASADEVAARLAEIEAIVAANDALIAAGSVGGDLGGETLGAVALAGDLLALVPLSIGSSVSVGLYADGERVATISNADRVVRLPAGFKARTYEVDVQSDIAIDQITIARTVDELKQVA